MALWKLLKKSILLTIVVGILLVWYSVSAIFIYSQPSDDAVSADAALVLGAAAYGSRPSPLFRARIDHAVALYQAGRVEQLIFSGGIGDRSNFSEAAVASAYAQREGVPESAILLEEFAANTRENISFSKEILDDNGLDSLLIVSTPFHMRRAMFIARVNDIDAYASPTFSTRWLPNGLRPAFFTREVVAYLHHRLLWPWLT